MNIKEIAKLAGVSVSTVSKVMNNKAENITPETQTRILKIAKEYHYIPYSSIRSTAPVRTYILGVLLRDFTETGKFIQGVLQAAAQDGYSILLYDCAGSSDTELKYVSALCRYNVDGVIWNPVNESSIEYKRHFDKAGIAVSLINAPMEGAFNIDMRRISYLCTERLIENKHCQICCLLDPNVSIASDVVRGFKDCLFEHQLIFNESMIVPVLKEKPLSDLISFKCTGFVCFGLTLATDLLHLLESLHYDIPYDYSIIAMEQDIRDAPGTSEIATYTIPYGDFGYAAIGSLIDVIEARDHKHGGTLFHDYVFVPGNSVDIARDFRSKHIIVVGDINMDSYFIVDELKPAGEITPIKHLSTAVGGRGCNMAIGCTRLGHKAILLGKVGGDTEASKILETLNHCGVNTEGIRREPSTDSGKAFIFSPHTGANSCTVLSGANTAVTPEYLRQQKTLFKNASYCLISSQLPPETVVACAKLAREHNIQTVLKPAALSSLSETLAGLIDYLVPDQEEAHTLVPEAHTLANCAATLLQKGVGTVIIAGKGMGCDLFRGSEHQHFEPVRNFAMIDQTGSSDAFISALVSFLNENYDLERAVQLALYSSAFCSALQGVYPALVDRETLLAYVEKYEPELLTQSTKGG